MLQLNFSEWFLKEGVTITHIDPEEDWEYAGEAYHVAQLAQIRPGSNKSPTIIALNDQDQVIGAAFTSWTTDHDASDQYGQSIAHYDFDIVVDPKWQGFDMVGIKLIKTADAERKNLESQYDQTAYTRLWVVNPKLAQYMMKHHGYDSEGEHEGGSHHLVKY